MTEPNTKPKRVLFTMPAHLLAEAERRAVEIRKATGNLTTWQSVVRTALEKEFKGQR